MMGMVVPRGMEKLITICYDAHRTILVRERTITEGSRREDCSARAAGGGGTHLGQAVVVGLVGVEGERPGEAWNRSRHNFQ